MDHDTPTDRRHPRIGVHDLRRDLRDADHDRYRLAAQLEQQRRSRTTPNRLLGAMMIIAGGFTSGLWFTLPARQQAAAQRPVELPPVAIPDAANAEANIPEPPVETAALPVVATPPEDNAAVRTAPAEPRSPSTRARRQRRAAAAPPANSRRSLDAERRTDVGRAADVRRTRPRPLSPGEFGRPASL